MNSKFDDVIDWAVLRDHRRVKTIEMGITTIHKNKDWDAYESILGCADGFMEPMKGKTPDQTAMVGANFCAHLVLGLRNRQVWFVHGRKEYGYTLLSECLASAWEWSCGLNDLEKGLFTAITEAAKKDHAKDWGESAIHSFKHLMTAGLCEMARQIELKRN